MSRSVRVLVCALAAAAAVAAGCGEEGRGTPASAPASAPADAKAYEGTGVVKRVDTANGKVTIAHEPIPSLGWPSMTMAFKVRDPQALAALQPEQKVTFEFVQQGRDFVVTSVH